MVNVHLFHDASNLLAVEQSPSVYSQFRKNALEYTLRRYNGKISFPIHSNFFVSLPLNPSDASVPYAIFGDFNFRLDAHRLLQVNLSKIDLSI
jgi:inositol-1,4,5-trisphosphate 5-phosphatase